MFTDIETFQQAAAASGLPPAIGGRFGGGDFRASVLARDFGPLKLVRLITPEGDCFRDARCARAEDEELWEIELMTRGRVRVEQGRGTVEVGPADFALIDPARPVRFASTDCTHMSVLVPRRQLRLRPGDAASLTGVAIKGDRGPAALVSSLVSSLGRDMTRSLTGFRAGEEDRSAAAVIELISVALQAQLGDVRACPDEALCDRIVGYIEARLSDRDLSPARIATAHHISLRRLHKLFEDQPLTVAAFIRQRRLERCRADLMGGNRTVAAVALRWGFADPAHFSRLFKATYGYNAAALMSSNRARIVKAAASCPGEDGGHT